MNECCWYSLPLESVQEIYEPHKGQRWTQSWWTGWDLGLGQRTWRFNGSVFTQQVVMERHHDIGGDHECKDSDPKDMGSQDLEPRKKHIEQSPLLPLLWRWLFAFGEDVILGKWKGSEEGAMKDWASPLKRLNFSQEDSLFLNGKTQKSLWVTLLEPRLQQDELSYGT